MYSNKVMSQRSNVDGYHSVQIGVVWRGKVLMFLLVMITTTTKKENMDFCYNDDEILYNVLSTVAEKQKEAEALRRKVAQVEKQAKRREAKRKEAKRKETKRKEAKRKEAKRKEAKRKQTKRKEAKRK